MGHGAEAPRDAKSVTKLRIEAYVMYRDNAIQNPSKQTNNVWLKLLGPIKKNYTWKENTTLYAERQCESCFIAQC